MAYSYFERSSVYHSDLRKATEDNTGISFMLTSDMKLSKDKINKIVKIQPYGDDDDYWLQAENESIAAQLEILPRNVWLIVKAHGDRASAILEVTDVDGVTIDPPDMPQVPQGPTGIKPPAPPSTPEQPPAPVSTPEPHPAVPSNIPVVQDKQDRTDELMLGCLSRAHEIVGRFATLHYGPDDLEIKHVTLNVDLIQRVGVSLFIHET